VGFRLYYLVLMRNWALWIGILALLISCAKKQEPAGVSPSSSPTAAQVKVEKTYFVYRDKDKISWEVFGDKILMDETQQKGRVEGIKLNYYDKQGKLYMVLKAKSADINMTDKNVYFKTGLKIDSQIKDEKLEVGALKWEGENRLLKGSGGIKYHKGKMSFFGENMKYAPDQKILELNGKVKIIYPLEVER